MRTRDWNFILSISAAATISYFLICRYSKNRAVDQLKQKKQRKKELNIDIGGIFGVDAGGTLTKIVYFETQRHGHEARTKVDNKQHASTESQSSVAGIVPALPRRQSSDNLAQLDDPEHKAALEQLYTFMDNAYGAGGSRDIRRDEALSVFSKFLGGRMHFLHFETKNMIPSIRFISSTAVADHIKSIGCTGGGAHKYANAFLEELEIVVKKFDELGCLIRGMHFALLNFPNECYTYRPSNSGSTSSQDNPVKENIDVDRPKESPAKPFAKEYPEKVVLPFNPVKDSNYFPYMVVNIGSGVSIVKVSSAGQYERVSGTSLGGGTYWGLCRLLTNCTSFESLLDIAENGNPEAVDMLVKDIYGGDCKY
jgi:type II pantothenate kinase